MVERVSYIYRHYLSFNSNAYPGLEFHGEVVFKHSDFLQQHAYKAFIKNSNLAGLGLQEIAKLGDSGQPFIPDDAVGFGFGFQFPKLENLIGDGIVIVTVVCFLKEFFCSSSSLASMSSVEALASLRMTVAMFSCSIFM